MSKDEVIDSIKDEIEIRLQQLAQGNDPDVITAITHVKALVLQINGNPDKCCTEVMNLMSMSDLEKMEIVLSSGNMNHKFESIMKGDA